MHVYLLEKENHPTYAVLANSEEEALERHVATSTTYGRSIPKFKTEDYVARKFAPGEDGEIIRLTPAPVTISYPLGLDKEYPLGSVMSTELV